MGYTKWTPELNVKLIECVNRAVASGFHKRQGPKREDTIRDMQFWNAVAVMMAEGPDSPSPAACSSQFKDAWDEHKAIQAAKKEEKRGFIDPELKKEWDRLDKMWNEADPGPDDFVQYTLENLAMDMDLLHRKMDALLSAWDIHPAKEDNSK